ncbi:glycosyltransferase [Geobacter sp. 60473]|uniref:glycosyltransferase n=1 Tax=Geobacter sp. 60473 TaxID=3080755 RepID=UPI002B319883|nr:hypothetical protein GEO60473_24460 [Geobacter sp. 60473]
MSLPQVHRSTAPRILIVTFRNMGSITARIRGLIFAEPFRDIGWTAEFIDVDDTTEDHLVEQAGGYDLVYLLKIPYLNLIHKLRRHTDARLVFDLTDALWMPHHRWNKWQDLEAILTEVDAVFSDNEFVADYGRKYNDNVVVIPACTQVERFDEVRPSIPVRADDSVVIGWVGTFSTMSALNVVRDPLERLSLRYPNLSVRLLIHGFPANQTLTGFQHTRFTLVPRYDEDLMIREVLRMDIGVFPPPYDLEDYAIRGPLKALVYMTAGVPPVCANAGACASLITDGQNGMLVNVPTEWEKKLEELIISRALREQIGGNALATVRRNHSLQTIFSKTVDALTAVLSLPRRSPAGVAGGFLKAAPFGISEHPTISPTAKRVMIACGHFWPSVGGIEHRLEQLGAALVKEGYDVTVMTPVNPDRDSDTRHGIRIRSIDPTDQIGEAPAWPYAVRQAITSGEYDACILVQDPLGNLIWSTEKAPLHPRTRLIIQPIINAFGYAMWKDRDGFAPRLAAILRSAQKVVTLTRNGVDAQFMAAAGIVPAYIPNASAVPAPAGDFRSAYGIPADSFLILHVANLYWTKNHLGLLDSLQNMPASWKLVLVGKPTGTPDCAKAVMEKLAERPEVLYIPGLSREWVSAAMVAADVIVLSSLGEGSPNTILEAMAQGKPWLATPQCGGANDNAGGIIVDLVRFPEYLDILYRTPRLRQTLGKLGHRHWQACLSWPKVVAGWIDLIERGTLSRTFDMPTDIREEMDHIYSLLHQLGTDDRLLTSGAAPDQVMNEVTMNMKPIHGAPYMQPPAGTTEQFIDVKPVGILDHPSSCYQALRDYEIHGFGKGFDAVRGIVAHIFANKLETPLAWDNGIWGRCLVVNLACELRDTRTGETFDVLRPAGISDISPDFARLEGSSRVSDIERYAQTLASGSVPPPTLYVSGKVLNLLGGQVNDTDIFMIDGARRLVALALNHRRHAVISLIVSEEEFPRFVDRKDVDELHRSISSLSWFNNYQSIPLVDIAGERSLTRFTLIDMTLLRDSRVADFGCNIGQASLKAVLAGARQVWGIEGMPDTYGIASRIGALAGFTNLTFLNVDFNTPDFREQIDREIPGVVDYSFFFSVYRTKELIQRDVLFQYIIDKTAKGIFFEGHADPKIDSIEYYTWLFDSFGLPCRYLGNSEGKLRPLFFLDLSHKPAGRSIPTVASQPRTEQNQRPVNIGMITYNRLDFTRQAIEALAGIAAGRPFTLTVVDNNSQDGTRDYLLEQKRKGIIKNLVLLDENVGVAKASNLAWSLEPLADYYLKLDNDIVIRKKGWLAAMVEIIDRLPQVGAVAYNFEPTSYPLQTVNGCRVRIKPEGNLGGACILIPRRTHQKLGFWCEDYGLYGEEDYDYGIRIRLAGLENAYMEDEEIGFHLPAGRAAVIDTRTFRAGDGVEEELHADYRAWKDEARRKTMASGILQRNLNAYRSGSRSLHAPSTFVAEWASRKAATGAAPFPKLKVAVYSLEHYSFACAQLRVLAPSRAADDRIEIRWGVTTENHQASIDTSVANWADVVLVQRFFPREETWPFIEKIVASGKPIIYETDDLFLDLPATNPHRGLAEASKPWILQAINAASAVTVSTEEMKRAFASYHQQIHVLPNLLDDRLWSSPLPAKTAGAPVVIGYAGTPDHKADLRLLEDVLERIAAKYGNRVAFRFMGCDTERIKRLPGFSSITFEPGYENYARTIRKAGIDIGLVPLEDNRFNRCKSNIKWLEYSACGIAGVYADLPPYRSCVKDGETGILVGGYDVDAWVAAIERLIDNPDRRHAMVLAARTEVLANYTLKSRGHLFLETWRTVAGRSDTSPAKGKGMTASLQPFAPSTAPTGADAPQASIIIPLYNKAEYTKQCLEALALNTEQALNYEVILVDNASSDGTAEYLRTLSGDVTIVTNLKNLGFANACNQGGRIARGRYLVFLNNDTIPHPGWLDGLIKGAEQDGADIVGARLLYPNGRVQHAGVAFDEQSIGYHIFNGFPADALAVNRKRFMQCVTAACMLVKQELFAELGGFDEGYVNGFEDVDFCLRAGERGRRILYTPESALIHFEETSEGRKDHDTPNIRRFLARWEGKVRCDHQDIYRSEGYRAERQADGRLRIYQVDAAPVSAAPTPPPTAASTAPQQITPTPGTGAAATTPSVSGREKALALKAEGRYVEAIEHLVKIVTAGDNSVLVDLGDCLASLEKYDDALALYEESLALCPTNVRALVGVGVVRYMTRRIAEAADAFSRALETDPADSKALCGLGMARCAQGRNAEGFELYGRALEAEPENLTAVHESVRLAYELGRFSEAARRIESYLRHHPGDIDILFACAGLLHMAGRNADARDALERLMVFSPEYSGAVELLAKLEGRDQQPGERVTEAEARRLKEDGKYEEALAAFSRAAEAGDSSALADMGDCLAQLGRLDEAAARYLEALDVDGTDLKALVGLGVLSIVQGKQVKAVTWFNRALKADPANAKALCGLGMVRNMQNKHDEAFSLLARAVDADPEGLTALHELIRLSYATGRFDEAGERLDRYLMHHPADLDMVFAQAGIRFKAGRYAEALSSIETVLLFASDYEGGLELREAITQAM